MLTFFVNTVHEIFISNISVVIAIVTLFTAILTYCIIRDKGVPPGPYGVPIFGYWPFLKSDIVHLHLLNLRKKYGDVFSFRVTGKLYINLASHKVLKEAHITRSDHFKERTSAFNLLGEWFGDGVVFTNGDEWQINRKWFLAQFRERGMSLFKENTADAMHETTTALIEELKNNTDKPLDILQILYGKSNQVIRLTLFGYNSPVSESDIESIRKDYQIVSEQVHSSNMVLIGRFARYFIMPFLPNYKESMKVLRNIKNTFRRMIDDHRRTFDEDNVRDMIDSYIKEKNTRRSKGDPTAKHFTDEMLAISLFQFVVDGVDTLAVFITFFLKALADHPEEQEKIYKELVEVCGEDRNPVIADRSKLIYTTAFILEAQRTANFVPLFPSLECTKETTVGGYRIPKGAVTLPNTYAIHNDPEVYEEPEKFDPTRFIAEGMPKPITFGIGKRACLGESFVMMQTFLFCTAMVKNFRIAYSKPSTDFELFMSHNLEITVTARK